MSQNGLLKEMQRVQARELHNTRSVFYNIAKSDRFELLEIAYGRARVAEDFKQWCGEVAGNPPMYPIKEYLHVVDNRLGQVAAEQKLDLDAPGVQELCAAVYDAVAVMPTRKAVAVLLTEYKPEEILAAVKEYASTFSDDKDLKAGMKPFFQDGGCAAVIYARRKRGE